MVSVQHRRRPRRAQRARARSARVGRRDHAWGQLLEAWADPTLEAIVTETPAHLRKVLRPDIGVALIDLDASEP